MTERKQALLVFSKPPIPGMVKTRLTKAHGGIFTDEQAAQFFKLSLYDVSELAMHALIEMQRDNDALVAADPSADKVTYDFFLSTTPASNLPHMKETFDRFWVNMDIHRNNAFPRRGVSPHRHPGLPFRPRRHLPQRRRGHHRLHDGYPSGGGKELAGEEDGARRAERSAPRINLSFF